MRVNSTRAAYMGILIAVIAITIRFATKEKTNPDEFILTVANASYIIGCIQSPFKTWHVSRPDLLGVYEKAEICLNLLPDAGLEDLTIQLKERYEQRADKN